MGWRPTATLARAVGCATVALALALVAGRPALVVLAVPFAVHAALALTRRPTSSPTGRARWRAESVAEGQATWLDLRLDGEAEDVTWVVRSSSQLDCEPQAVAASGPTSVRVGARRWGVREPAGVAYLATGGWGGFRVGPAPASPGRLRVLPAALAYDASAPLPHPLGLVGAHASHRTGAGLEYNQTRAFASGDRLRRINWRVSSRTPSLLVDTTLTEDDASVLLVVDLLTDVAGRPGNATSADLGVRATATLAGHHLALGDRVGVRVLASSSTTVRAGSGRRHLRRIQGVLAGSVPGSSERVAMPPLRTPPGTTIILLSPLLATALTDALGELLSHGRTLVVVDTLPPDARPPAAPGTDPELAALAWRMRALDRAEVVAALERVGVRVVPWRGPGSLDVVLRQLARGPR